VGASTRKIIGNGIIEGGAVTPVLVVTGTLNPDATGNYYQAGTHAGKPYYRQVALGSGQTDFFFIWWLADFGGNWAITLGGVGNGITEQTWDRFDPNIEGAYTPNGFWTGTPIVTLL
jgi:hypothetical protein